MHPSDSTSSRQGGVLSSWQSLTDWLAHALSSRYRSSEEIVADLVKDTLLDLGYDPADDEQLEPASPVPLPPLDVKAFIAMLNSPWQEALCRVAEVINANQEREDPRRIEQQVHAIFDELARAALEQAFQLRQAAAEADLPPPGRGADWARKYRRMMAREGRG
jgi:hypothetical protein